MVSDNSTRQCGWHAIAAGKEVRCRLPAGHLGSCIAEGDVQPLAFARFKRVATAESLIRSDEDGITMPMRPGSSEKERPVSNGEVGGSSPPRGSAQHDEKQDTAADPKQSAGATAAAVASGTWHYVVVRRELAGGALLAQVLHASADSVKLHLEQGQPYPADTRGVVLVATKEQMARLGEQLAHAGCFFHLVTETDGPLAGSSTAIAFITSDRASTSPFTKHLRPWRP